jgi:GntR family transcriptional regulator
MPDSLQTVFTDRWGIDRTSGVPAYEQIAERAVWLIDSGCLGVGDRLPPERDLATWVGVSRMTARAALASLAQRGLVDRDVGRGTFVARPKLEHDLGQFGGFTEMILREGRSPNARLRSLNVIAAPAAVARELAIAAGDPVYRIERLRFADEEPLTLEDSWVAAQRFPGLLDHDMRGSLYAWMRDVYDSPPVRAVERLEPVLADDSQAQALAVAPASPLMLITRVAFTVDDVAVEFARDHHRGDRARFVVEVATRIPDAVSG